MRGEIIAIGDELTSGRILNTTSSFAAGHLYAAGHDLLAMATVGDDPATIKAAVDRALARADFIIITGGLGATSDDVTNEAVAHALGRKTVLYPDILADIENAMPLAQADSPAADGGALRHPMEKMAWLPEGSKVLKPGSRMAGHLLVHAGVPLFFLPGVPYEMKELMLDCVLPYLASWKGVGGRQVRQKVYRVFGLPETEINRRLAPLENTDHRVRLGYYPVFPEVHVSLTAIGEEQGEIDALFQQYDIDIVAMLSPYLYGVDGDSLEVVVGRLLRQREERLACGESCTGGLIAHKITMVPGSSDYFSGAVVAYSNQLKEQLLGVPAEILARHGAVSRETARAMAAGARKVTGADWSLAVTGIAGPGGGSDRKPVGLVYVGLAGAGVEQVERCQFQGDRWKIQAITAFTALDLLRRRLLPESVNVGEGSSCQAAR